jgi:predicted enzyme related to lactoylglutathione lyase
MPEVSVYAPGAFCWIELATTDPAGAKRFYADVLGWEFADTGVPGGADAYTMVRLGDKELGGMYALTDELKSQGVPPHWLSYISVDDANESTDRAEKAGAEIKMGPIDVHDIGRMSVIQDPTGAVFAVWQAKKHPGSGVVNDVGTVCWHELMTNDVETAKTFYGSVFGYDVQVQQMGPMPYTLFLRGDKREAGMMAITPEMGPVPPHWMIYVSVRDCEGTVAKAKVAGARILVTPMDVPGVGRFSTVMDPQGAVFSVIQLTA